MVLTSRFKRIAIPIIASLLVILAAGSTQAASLDPSFGNGGTVITKTGNPPYQPVKTGDYTGNVWDLKQDRRGRLVAGGGTGAELLAIRYLPNGARDSRFGSDGKVSIGSVTTPNDPETSSNRIRALSLLADGKILLAGEAMTIDRVFLGPPSQYFVRLLSDGTLDSTFATYPNYFDAPPPTVVLGEPLSRTRDMVVQSDGRILVSGIAENSFNTENRSLGFLNRFLQKTNLPSTYLPFDRSFGQFGRRNIVPAKWPFKNAFNQVKLLRSGKILVGGNLRNRFFVGRLTSQGDWDRSFGKAGTGKVVSEIRNDRGKPCLCAVGSGMATDRKGRIVLTGWSFPDGTQHTLNVLRYKPNGFPDRSFGRGGKVRLSLNQFVRTRRVVVHPNGTIFVAAWLGYQREQKFSVFAFKPDGRPLRSFFNKGRYIRAIGETSTAEDLLIDNKGRLVVSGGTFKDGDASFVLKRFLVD